MSHKSIEEETKVPQISGEDELESNHDNKRLFSQHTKDQKELKLVHAVNLGLTVACASKIFNMSTPNAQSIIDHYEKTKRQKLASTPSEPNSDKDSMSKAKLDSML